MISLPRPEGYQGFDSMFPGDGSKSPIRIVEEKEEDHDPDLEADIVRRWTSDPFRDPSANMSECPALQAALFDFIISGAIRRLRGQDEKHHSMLIHTKHTTNSMRPLKELVDDSVNTVWRRALIRSRTDKLRGSSREIYEGIRDHYEARFSKDIDNPPEWDEVHQAIRDLYRKGVDVLEVNHETGENLDYDMYPDGRTVIAIGGNRLSRGLTLEGLCVSYFIRSSQDPKADTMMQMGRWFGFRPGYSDLVRIYTTSNLNEHFDLIRQMEDSLRDDVERLEALGKTPDDFALRVMRAMNVRPTSDVKMQNVRISYYSFDSTILPKQGKFHFDDEARLRGNLTHVGSMLNNLDRENDATRVGGSWLWKGVGLDWAERLIAGLDLPNDGFKMADLKRYID